MTRAPGVPPLDAPERLRVPLARCIRGEIPPNVCAMGLLTGEPDPRTIEGALERTMELLDREGDDIGVERLRNVAKLIERHPEAHRLVREILAVVPHDDAHMREPDAVAFWSAAFDRAFAINPEASVALYSLGDRELLDVATAEIVRLLRETELLGAEKHVLDLGCGFGRLSEALAGEAGHIVGVDISERMVVAARARCADLANVHVILGSGRDLQPLPDESIDTAVAVDAFPYIVAGGPPLVKRMMAELGRVLKRSGSLAIFNWSYEGDAAAREAGIRAAADGAGLVLRAPVHARFLSWDAELFLLGRNDAADL